MVSKNGCVPVCARVCVPVCNLKEVGVRKVMLTKLAEWSE